MSFSGRESLAEAEARYTKMLHPAEIGREPVPFLPACGQPPYITCVNAAPVAEHIT
ncbi:hypothetical protein ACFPH6_10610 [Streptomyces xiangluensis]|uniref:Uncharacterized protein n=1 Tax=Streptomyces xiangluensis TaxID=2665720 RepID=A0ABV8YI62_9ACTN